MSASPPPIHVIVAGVDCVEHDENVFRAAALLGQRLNAQVFLVRVLELPPDIPPAGRTTPDGLANTVEAATRASFRELMETVSDVRFGPPIVVEGEPWRRILDVARDLHADLVVVGGHRRHGLERVLGTVATKVVNHADRNVLVVRGTTEATRG